jgi:hypothetical protein
VKTTIFLDDEVYKKAKLAADERHLSFSAYISNCIRATLGEVILDITHVIPPISPGEAEDIRARLSTLETLWKEHMEVIPEVLHNVTPMEDVTLQCVEKRIPITPGDPDMEFPDVEKSIPIVEENIPVVDTFIPVVEITIPMLDTPLPGENKIVDTPIFITPEMREEMLQCIHTYVSNGHERKSVAAMVGMPYPSFNKIGNEHAPLKTIKPSQYKAIRSLQ